MTRRVSALFVTILLGVGSCSPANTGTWTRPTTGRAAPQIVGYPLSKSDVLAKRVRLTTPGSTLLHKVAIDSPGGMRVMMGRMRFPTHNAYMLEASAAIGSHLFSMGFKPDSGYAIDVAEHLQGRFPAERLARDIRHIYLSACSDEATTVTQSSGSYTLTCRLTDKTQVVETINGSTMETIERVVVEPGGRTLTITYLDYAWWGDSWHPKTITLRSDKARVNIVLAGYEADREASNAASARHGL